MSTPAPRRPWATVAGALLYNPAIGSLYAWSVFVRPLEQATGAARADIWTVFALANVCSAGASLLAPALYRHVPPAALLAAAALTSAGGLWLAGAAASLPLLNIGYGGAFGFAAGLSYSVTLQSLNAAVTSRGGLWNGIGVGAFAIGAILLARPLGGLADTIGPFATFQWMAAGLATVGLLAAALLWLGGVGFPTVTDGRGRGSYAERPFPLIWLGFALAAAAGVMSIGHAAGIVAAAGGAEALATLAVGGCAVGNAAGRISAGWLSDRLPPGRVAAVAHAVALVGFGVLLAAPGAAAAAIGVALQGLAYGLASGAYPAMLPRFFGVARFGRYFGGLMTAYGVAGLSAPWLAGRSFDASGGYGAAAAAGLVMAAAALALSLRLPRPEAA